MGRGIGGSDDDDEGDSDEDADQGDKLAGKQQIGLFEDAISLEQVRLSFSALFSRAPGLTFGCVFRRSGSRRSRFGVCVRNAPQGCLSCLAFHLHNEGR